MPRSTDEEKSRVVELYFSTVVTIQQIVDKLGYPTHQCLGRWLEKDKRYIGQNFKRSFYSLNLKMQAIAKVMSGEDAKAVASELGIKSHASIYNWINIYSSEGEQGLFTKRMHAKERKRRKDEIEIPDDPEELKKRCRELELENAVMKEMLDGPKSRPARKRG